MALNVLGSVQCIVEWRKCGAQVAWISMVAQCLILVFLPKAHLARMVWNAQASAQQLATQKQKWFVQEAWTGMGAQWLICAGQAKDQWTTMELSAQAFAQ